MSIQYINIHSHHLDSTAHITLLNGQDGYPELPPQHYCSIGAHPWYIPTKKNINIEQLRTLAALPTVLAIGECGLDYHIKDDRTKQMEVFEQQIALANTFNKPLIIHCVQAYNDVLHTLKKSKVPAIFHGFNKKKSIAQQVLDDGHYLSFGYDILKNKNTWESLMYTPSDRLFFETDNCVNPSVVEVYNYASKIRKTDLEIIILHIQKNFESIFKL